MWKSKTLATSLMAGIVVMATPAVQAESLAPDYLSPIAANAENIRSLNIMLMVTSLRCRDGAHDFQGEYELFAQAHQQNLEEAHNHLTQNMVATYGERGSSRALDRIGVSIANSYGDGHPTLGCSDLKQATLELAMSQDKAQLAHMAGRLLSGQMTVPEAALQAEETAPVETGQSRQRPEKSRVLSAPRPIDPEGASAPVIPVERTLGSLRG